MKKKVVINKSNNIIQEVMTDASDIDVILVDFDEDDDETLSAAYVERVLNNKEMIKVTLKSLISEGDYNAECAICGRKELINFNSTNWLPSAFLRDDHAFGPVCPACHDKWIVFDENDYPLVKPENITLDQMHLVPNLVKYLQERKQEADEQALSALSTKIAWFAKFYDNMIMELIEEGVLDDMEEAALCLEFMEDLDGQPAIVKTAGNFELLGEDVCIDIDHGKYITITKPSNDYYLELQDAEVLRCYKS